MSKEKRFGTAMLGFKKSDVNLYIEKILYEFDNKLKEKDDEILQLRSRIKEVENKYSGVFDKAEKVTEERVKIADVLIKAQEQAEAILEEGRIKAEEQRKELEVLINKEKQKLLNTKEEIKLLKDTIVATLKKHERELEEFLEADISTETE